MTSWEWVEENPVITEKECRKLLRLHHIDFVDFLEEFPLQDSYDSATIVAWLGY